MTFEYRSGDIPQLGVSPDGKRILLDQDNGLHVLALAGRASEGCLPQASGGSHFSILALFSPFNDLVLTGGAFEGRLQLWRLPGETSPAYEVRQLVPPDRSPATCAAFAPDGSFVVTASRRRQLLVWPLPDAKEIGHEFPTVITLVEHAVESSSRQVRIWAELANPEGRLVPGTTVTMTVSPID
jgi:WD40 repeat protein